MHYKSSHLTVINRDRCFSQWSCERCWWGGRKRDPRNHSEEYIVLTKVEIYIYKNVNYLHKINGGSTENVICHSEKQSFPTREEDNSVFGWKRSTESTWKHYFFGLFPQISTLFTFPNPLPPDREAEGITAFSECPLQLSGASLMCHTVWRVIACIWNLLGLFHPKMQERLPLAHEPLGWVIQTFSEALRYIM